MKKLFRIVQFGANLGIIVIGFLLMFIVLDQYIISPKKSDLNPMIATSASSSRLPDTNGESLIGTVLPLNGVNWKESNTTVVMYLSTTCHFCSESVPFYQRLVKEKAKNNFKLVPVLPQNENEASEYLESHNVKVDQILSSPLASSGITGTPTLLLAGSDGTVVGFWRGKLNDKKEAEVLLELVRRQPNL